MNEKSSFGEWCITIVQCIVYGLLAVLIVKQIVELIA